ncbi:hypothetical protein TNCV_3910171 [Trichonephila clavipes]|uniref:Uncharacterized protein n=1 Tax=Trichonephila inaurata madagascariensis TaxID=2747483 RepID=A0A8X6IQ27_9ARAC|nr:hypothetical protein TNIN_69071 [Trichonephila inaurata madagascariensis]GFT82084.1 hypothetical protein TNCV_3910171 [Trichonephila clavipes]
MIHSLALFHPSIHLWRNAVTSSPTTFAHSFKKLKEVVWWLAAAAAFKKRTDRSAITFDPPNLESSRGCCLAICQRPLAVGKTMALLRGCPFDLTPKTPETRRHTKGTAKVG